jgi:hypothetical protein
MLLNAASSPSTAGNRGPDVPVKINSAHVWQDNSIPSELNAAFELGQLNTMRGHDVALRRAFLERLAATFVRQGFTEKMVLIDDAPETVRGRPILVIDLARWSLGPRSRFDCHFKARYLTPESTTDLGAVEYTDIMLQGARTAFRNHGVEKATDVALGQFHQQAVKRGLFAKQS